MIEFNSMESAGKDMLPLTPRKGARPKGIKFRNAETGQEMQVVVIDKFPQMGDVHVEGRRIVEVSVEMFVPLIGLAGFEVIDPNEPAPGAPEVKEGEDG